VDKNSLLMQYLGTRSRFIQGTVPQGDQTMTFVVAVSYSSDSPPKVTPRVIDASWASP